MIVLASQSASRRAMLAAAGVAFEAIPAQVDERALEAGLVGAAPEEIARTLATAKALDDTPVPSGEPIVAVLELNAGRAAELGIAPGDKVDWSR